MQRTLSLLSNPDPKDEKQVEIVNGEEGYRAGIKQESATKRFLVIETWAVKSKPLAPNEKEPLTGNYRIILTEDQHRLYTQYIAKAQQALALPLASPKVIEQLFDEALGRF